MTEKGALPLVEHLRELRRRLIVCVIAGSIGFAVSYYFSEDLYRILTRPLIPAMPKGYEYVAFTGVIEPFFVYLKIGITGAIILASPVILHQVWGFVAPGLHDREKRWFLPVVCFSLVLFISGVLFSYFVVFPFAFKYLMSYASEELRPVISMDGYFSLVTKLMIAFGAVFQLPLAMLVAARVGLASAGKFVSWWRYAVVAIVIASAILTPTPDVFNQLLMAGPLLVLYALGVLLAWLFGKKKERDL